MHTAVFRHYDVYPEDFAFGILVGLGLQDVDVLLRLLLLKVREKPSAYMCVPTDFVFRGSSARLLAR
jgi:hypothetical protein